MQPGSRCGVCPARLAGAPGRSSAASIMSSRLVMPITRMLLSECTPSILESSWLTTVSPTPASDLCMPRCLQIESISSKMMMCRSCSRAAPREETPSARLSRGEQRERDRVVAPRLVLGLRLGEELAHLARGTHGREGSGRGASSLPPRRVAQRTFSSAWPTNLDSTSGPLTTLGSLPLSIFPIWRAMSVLPVPGGPCSIMPVHTRGCEETAPCRCREGRAAPCP